MARTFRRTKHSYGFYGYTKTTPRMFFKSIHNINSEVLLSDLVDYFTDNYKSNSRMLTSAARKMMRADARSNIKREFNWYKQNGDWENYCLANYNRYSDPWAYD